MPAPLRRRRPRRSPQVLALDLSEPVVDGTPPGLIGALRAARRPGLREVTDALAEASRDPRIHGLVARVDGPASSWAHAQELRAAVTSFRATAKPTVAHARSFSEAGSPALAYLVATGFGEIHLQPSGELGVTGVAVVQRFVAGLLAKLQVQAEFGARDEYKTARDLLTETAFTPAQREAFEAIVDSLYSQLLSAVAAGRGLQTDAVAAALDRAPLSAAEAKAAGLVDRLAYRDESVAMIKERFGPGTRLVHLDRYQPAVRRRQRRPGRRTTVALVPATGQITVGRSRRGLTGPVMGADTVIMGLQQATNDPQVAAIVLRVESPGGSAVASDAIWRAVVRARQAGTPVVVSMAGVAGSGGYWISMGADHIIASGGTLTGSIGVVYGKLVTRALTDRLGVTSDEAHRGANALMLSSEHAFTTGQWERIDALLDRVYEEFLTKAADGRGLDRAAVHDAARGRVWTGADALARGLVDELGGYPEALAAARRLAGVAPDARLRLRVLPRQAVLERLGLRSSADPDTRMLLGVAGAAIRSLRGTAPGQARMPGWVDAIAGDDTGRPHAQ